MIDSNETVVHLDRIAKRFGATIAVQNLNLKINTGEFVTLLGPSGCGKSTTLRILGGFERPDDGRVILSGRDVTALPPNKRNVNMVFQDYALFPHMTVSQNIAFGLELKGMTRPQIAAKLDDLLAFLQIEALGGRRPDQLSGGQRQRVALARALAPDPDLLLLDEPLGALDAKLRTQVQAELKDIQQRTGKTFVFVTHDQDEALTMSDRIIVMNEGVVEQDGTPEDLYLSPKNQFVARFIGETNFIDGEVRGTEKGQIVISWNGIDLRGTATNSSPLTGQQVTASVRLEKIGFFNERPNHGNVLSGQMINRVFKGSRTMVDVRISDAGDAVLKAYVDPAIAAKFNSDPIWIAWDPANMTVLTD
ncbi:MAG: ABC transporter ATP-binding protein [Alphaproteobacteria bacterium]